jgi:Flp pilus assembly pilin Flp
MVALPTLALPLLTLLRRLWRDRAGVSLVEFALVMPVCSLLILGGTEVARYVLLNQKLDRVATAVSDLIAQEDAVSATDITNIFDAAPNLTWPFNIQTNGRIIVSSIGQVSGQTRVLWQRMCPGNGCSWSGTPTNTSHLGIEGGLATMPTGFTVSATDNVIVAEVFYSFTPFFWRQMPAGTLYHTAFTRPRLSNLTTIN